MDRVLNPKDEKKTIYEIYRACRLCGAGAGYKMPIIQSVVDLESHGLELRQKIKECVQIEVNHTDRMPPLVCELCVDKVNDFYDFLTLCQQTNKRTRQRLGLPPQPKSRDSPDCENCISGVSEPITIDCDVEQVSRQRSRGVRAREPVEHVRIKVEREKENGRLALSRSSTPEEPWERRRRSPVSKRTTRHTAESTSSDVQVIDDTPLPEPKSKLKRPRDKDVRIDTPPPTKKVKLPEPKPKETPKPGPKSRKTTKEPEPPKPAAKEPVPPKTDSKPKPASKKEIKHHQDPAPPASKTSRTKSKPEPVRTRTEPVNTKPEPVKTKPEPVKTKPEPVKTKPDPVKTKPVEIKNICGVCDHQVKTAHGLLTHCLTKHVPTFTAAKFACNACELWFPTTEECAAHHRSHRAGLPYKCHRCYGYFKLQLEYENHFAENLCLSVYEVPDVQCWRCCHGFATGALLSAHACPGEDGRPGGKCSKCNRSYALLKTLLKHEASCTYKKKGEVTIDPEVQARLLSMQVKISRCDGLLAGPRVNVASISHRYGLDSKARYPYLPASSRRERPTKAMLKANHMVRIEDSVKLEYCGSDSNDSQKVDSLASMTLKSINKADKGDDNDELAKKIFSIIDNLDVDDGPTNCDSDNPEKVGDEKQSDGESKGQKNVSDGDDDSQGGSDSILYKIGGKSEDTSVNDESDKMEVVKDVTESDSVVFGDVRVNTAAADVKSDKTTVDSDSPDAGIADVSPKESEVSSATIGDSDKMDVDCEKSDVSTENVDVSSVKSEDKVTTELDKRLSGTEDKTVEENEETNVKETDDDAKSSKDDNDGAIYEENKKNHDDLITSTDVDMTSKNDETNEQIRIETSQSTEEKANDEEKSYETQNFNSVNDDCSKNDNIDSSNQATQDCSLDFNKDKLESDSCRPDNINANVHITVKTNVNQEETYPTVINNEVFSKIDEITNKILKETEREHDNSADESAIEKIQRNDNHSDSISLNSLKSVNDIELQDKFNVDDLSDDDKKLMAELDAQIGDINEKHKNDDVTTNGQNDDQKASEIHRNNYNDNAENDNSGVNDIASNDDYDNQRLTDKNSLIVDSNQNGPSNHMNGTVNDQKSKDYLIDNLLRKQDDLKSLELDSVSDEDFNFDA